MAVRATVGRQPLVNTRLAGRQSFVDTTRVGRQGVSPVHAAKAAAEVAEKAVEAAPAEEPAVKVAEKVSNYIGFLPGGAEITVDDIMKAQKAWGDAVVAIGKAGDGAKALAEETARTAYAFDLGPIMFKPTLASEIPFRQDIEGTLSYFVGDNDRYPEDNGFALRPWTNVKFVNDTVKIQGNIAIAMGHYYFTDKDGNDTKAEYTKGYVKTPDERVLLFLQDSSLPYSPS